MIVVYIERGVYREGQMSSWRHVTQRPVTPSMGGRLQQFVHWVRSCSNCLDILIVNYLATNGAGQVHHIRSLVCISSCLQQTKRIADCYRYTDMHPAKSPYLYRQDFPNFGMCQFDILWLSMAARPIFGRRDVQTHSKRILCGCKNLLFELT